MFIDIHAHAYRKPFLQPYGWPPWPTPEDLLPFYDEIGVSKAVLLPQVTSEAYMPQSNEEILEAAGRYPDRFIPFCNFHPCAYTHTTQFPFEQVISQYIDQGCRGIGEVMYNHPFSDPFLSNLLRAVNSFKLPLTFHLGLEENHGYGICDDPGLPGLDYALSQYPDIKFLGHSGVFWAEIGQLELAGDRGRYPGGKVIEGAVPKLMRRHPNLYGDLSAGSGANALTRDEEYAIGFLNEFQDRLLFGLDICTVPVPDERRELPDFLRRLLAEEKISQTVFDKVSHINAEKLLNL